MERIYKTMTTTGAGSVALGIVVLVTGIATGVVAKFYMGEWREADCIIRFFPKNNKVRVQYFEKKKGNKNPCFRKSFIYIVCFISDIFFAFLRLVWKDWYRR